MLPIHYVAKFGPSSLGVVDTLLGVYKSVSDAKADNGKTPLDMAQGADYPECDEVAEALIYLSVPSDSSGNRGRAVSNDSTMDGGMPVGKVHSHDSLTDAISVPSVDFMDSHYQELPSGSQATRIKDLPLPVLEGTESDRGGGSGRGDVGAPAPLLVQRRSLALPPISSARTLRPPTRKPLTNISTIVSEIESIKEEMKEMEGQKARHGDFVRATKARLSTWDTDISCARMMIGELRRAVSDAEAGYGEMKYHSDLVEGRIVEMSSEVRVMADERKTLVKAVSDREESYRKEKEAMQELFRRNKALLEEGGAVSGVTGDILDRQVNRVSRVEALLRAVSKMQSEVRSKQ